jgi:hypothetical protein
VAMKIMDGHENQVGGHGNYGWPWSLWVVMKTMGGHGNHGWSWKLIEWS